MAGCTIKSGQQNARISPNATDAIPDSVGLETLVDGLDVPLDVAFTSSGDQRYVAEKRGLVHVHDADGLRDDPLLDLRDTVETGTEKGLLGIALHPDFAENRRLFVRYSSPRRAETPSEYSHTFVLSEFEVTADGRQVAADSERTVLEIPEPQPNHNAGAIAFGPDGSLYVGIGDGGGGGDHGLGHVADWYDGNPGGNGQDVTENLLGSILRIDVDERENGRAYGIPADNPLVGRAGLDEHYAWGFRNPWRMSFDDDRLIVGDVGQSNYEEVSLVEAGGNYGWNVREGTHCFAAESCPDRTPKSVRGGEPLVDPIIEYPHADARISGNSVTGGYVYRGSAVPALEGVYVFSDLDAGGQLFAARPPDGDDTGRWPTQVVTIAGEAADALKYVYSFGRNDGEVYVLSRGVDSAGLHRIVPAE